MKAAEAFLRLARIITNVAEGTATGGSTTTLVDTARWEPDDYFTTGTIWFLSGTQVGKSAVVTGWNGTTKTFSFLTPGGAIVAGVLYAVAPRDFPRYILQQGINAALNQIGSPIEINEALLTVSGQERYTLPTGVQNIQRVQVNTRASEPYYPMVHQQWEELEGKLVFYADPPQSTDYVIRLFYTPWLDAQPVDADSDTVAVEVAPERLAWQAAVHCLRWKVQRVKDDDPSWTRLLNEALAQAAAWEQREPLIGRRRGKDTKLAGW